MTEQEFISQYQKDKPMLEAWGEFVIEKITNELSVVLSKQSKSINDIIKIPVIKPRVKDTDSIITKAFYRKKYKNPYEDITDKVGIRFVVLLQEHIGIITEIIKKMNYWVYSEDVDFKKNIEENPELFTYQSVHYVVRCKQEIETSGITIRKSTPCEIQIRTLLQHAYAELSHDRVYKKEKEIPIQVKRILARSMALIETTDMLFQEVDSVLMGEDKMYEMFMELAMKFYRFNQITDALNRFVFDSYKDFIKQYEITNQEINNFLIEKNYIIDKIREKENYLILYRQPVVLILYYLIYNYKNLMLEIWPLEEEMLRSIFSDLGIAFSY